MRLWIGNFRSSGGQIGSKSGQNGSFEAKNRYFAVQNEVIQQGVVHGIFLKRLQNDLDIKHISYKSTINSCLILGSKVHRISARSRRQRSNGLRNQLQDRVRVLLKVP